MGTTKGTHQRRKTKMTRTYFSRKKAEAFAETLKQQGLEKVEIWMGRDGFKQAIFTVKWF